MQTLTRQSLAWSPVTDKQTARTVIKVVRVCAERLKSTANIVRAIEASRRQSAFPDGVHWVAYSVAKGYAGLPLLWAQMDACFPDEEWDLVGREHLTLAAQDLEQYSDLPLGIFSGITGVAFAAWQLSREGTRYRRLLQTLDAAILPRALALANKLKDANGCCVSEFDAISGLSGIGAYLLCRIDDADCRGCLTAVLEALVELLDTPEELPAWHTPATLIRNETSQQMYPHGWLNCGLAHGIPGPLALLSLAHLQGISINNLPNAIGRTADWLCNNRFDDEWGVNWPTAVPLEFDEVTNCLRPSGAQSAPDGPSRCAWCYGRPGVARALWLAGEAFQCERYRNLALSAMDAVFRKPVRNRHIDSPSFCHGVAGLLEIALRFVNDCLDNRFAGETDVLLQQILATYSPDHLLGFRHLEIPGNEIDQAGLLDGVPGIALVLLAAVTNVPPSWDRLFLLS